jgi:hypothetical protein
MDLKKLHATFNPGQYFRLVNTMTACVQASAKRFPLRMSMKDSEITRRVAWCCGTAIMLRQIHHWSVERICDTLPGALITWLRDGSWEPPDPNTDRRMWSTKEA